MNDSQNNNSSGFSSREILHQLWNKMDSIELKLDAKLNDIDRRVIVLELEALRRDGPVVSSMRSMEDRINNLEVINSANNKIDSVLKNQKNSKYSKKTIIISTIVAIILFANLITTIYTVAHG